MSYTNRFMFGDKVRLSFLKIMSDRHGGYVIMYGEKPVLHSPLSTKEGVVELCFFFEDDVLYILYKAINNKKITSIRPMLPKEIYC